MDEISKETFYAFALLGSLGGSLVLIPLCRRLALKLDMVDGAGVPQDINETDGGGAGGTDDFTLLTLNNGAVDMFPSGYTDNLTVRIKSGFYITHIYKAGNWGSNYEDPLLFCEVAQR